MLIFLKDRYFVADTVQTKITDAQMTKVDGRYMIATEFRPFVNYDAGYRFKFDSGTIQNEAGPVERENGQNQGIRVENAAFSRV